MSKCPLPHTPTILVLISPVPAHALGDTDIAELEFQKLETRGLGDAQEWCMDSGAEWVGWAEAITLAKMPCNANAALA